MHFFLLGFEHFQRKGGGVDPNRNTFELGFCLNLDVMKSYFPEWKKFLVGVQEHRWGGGEGCQGDFDNVQTWADFFLRLASLTQPLCKIHLYFNTQLYIALIFN